MASRSKPEYILASFLTSHTGTSALLVISTKNAFWRKKCLRQKPTRVCRINLFMSDARGQLAIFRACKLRKGSHYCFSVSVVNNIDPIFTSTFFFCEAIFNRDNIVLTIGQALNIFSTSTYGQLCQLHLTKMQFSAGF